MHFPVGASLYYSVVLCSGLYYSVLLCIIVYYSVLLCKMLCEIIFSESYV